MSTIILPIYAILCEIPFALWITFTAQSPGLKNGQFHKFGELLLKLSNQANYSRGYFHNIVARILGQNEEKKKMEQRKEEKNSSKNKKQKIAPLQQDSTLTSAYILFWYK